MAIMLVTSQHQGITMHVIDQGFKEYRFACTGKVIKYEL